jgi:hypothetical protein
MLFSGTTNKVQRLKKINITEMHFAIPYKKNDSKKEDRRME